MDSTSSPYKIEVRKFQPQDGLKLLSEPTAERFFSKITVEQLGEISRHPAYSFFINDKLVSCGGIVIQEEAEAWSIVPKGLSFSETKEVVRNAKKILREIMDEFGLKRIRATWKTTFDPKIKWLKHLGFRKTNETIETNGILSYVYVMEI